jgi:hypothetical protein
MAVGMEGYLGVGVESATAGNAATGAYSATVIAYIPFVSETLASNRNDLADPGIVSNFYNRRFYNGLQRVEGGVQTVMHPIDTGFLIRACFDACTAQPGWDSTSHGGVRTHRFTALGTQQFQAGSGSDLPTLTLEVNRGPVMGSGSSFVYYNCAGNVAEFVAEAGQFVRANFEFLGRDFGGKPRSVPTYIPPDTFLWNTVSVSLAGAAKPVYESLTVRIDNKLEAVPLLDGRLRPGLIKRNDFGAVTVNGTLSFQNFEDYDAFLQGSQYLLQMTFTGKQISTAPANNEIFKVTVPQFRYATYGLNIAGPQRITTNFTGTGALDPTSGYAMEVTMTNTRISNYAVNTTA